MTHPDITDIPPVSTHGGARSNAGRKKGSKPAMKARTLRFTPDALKRLERLKKALGLSWPKLVERLVEGFDGIPAASPVAHPPGCVCGGCMKVWREKGGQP